MDKKTYYMQVPMSEADARLLKDRAAAKRLSLSAFVRMVLMDTVAAGMPMPVARREAAER